MCLNTNNPLQALKIGQVPDDEEEDDLYEASLLESPFDKVEPYGLFKDVLMSTSLRTCLFPFTLTTYFRRPSTRTTTLIRELNQNFEPRGTANNPRCDQRSYQNSNDSRESR